jgi:protocatechuate 3,4-dioxygenase beta subunit
VNRIANRPIKPPSPKRRWIFLTLLALILFTSCSGSLPNTGNTAAGTNITVPATAQSAPGTIQATLAGNASLKAQCKSPADPTPDMTEGPYYKTGSPEQATLLDPGMTGTKLVVTGYVLTTACKPIAGAWLDFWQANAQGQYDNAGYTLRGHQFTDVNGRYQLETVIPGLYPGRTEHIHVKVQAPGGPVLTTQLFFPGVPQNDSDGIFSTKLLLAMQDSQDGKLATYDFILATQ